MKIVALNIRHGGGKRMPQITRYLGSSDADVVIVSEFRENENAPTLRNAMSECGLRYFAAASTQTRENSVCVFAKAPFTARTYPELGPHANRVVSAKFPELTVYGVYFPQRDAKADVFDFFLNGIPSKHTEPQIVSGDFNTGLHGVDEAGATFHCAGKLQAMANSGYIDCWRSRNPNERVFSWFSQAGNGFRIDHAFANAAADGRIKGIAYDHAPREMAFTDHSALAVEISGE